MVRWTEEQALAYGLRQVNRPAARAEPEPNPERASVGAEPEETRSIRRVRLRFQSFRIQPQDPDNGFIKHHVDALRHCGVLADDTTAHIEVEVRPDIKVGTREDERTEIELIDP